jgi:mono/diheme cytochrome c family protein
MSSPSRRSFLIGATLTTADLLVPIRVIPSHADPDVPAPSPNGASITDWIRVAGNGDITLGLSQPEVGQGSYTVLPAILAEELDADWAHITVAFVTGKPAYEIAFNREAPVQKEGASMSTTVLYARLRQAGAAARDVLLRAAAQHWGVAREECRTEKSYVINARGERLSYGELAAAAAELALNPQAPLKDPARFTLIGKPVARLDTPAKCNGSAVFGIDVAVPDMLNGAIRMAPSFTGSVVAIRNETEVSNMPGVRAIVKIPAVAMANEEPGSQHPKLTHQPRLEAVCVVADHFWQASRAIAALDVGHAIDGERVTDLGETIYVASCAQCHEPWRTNPPQNAGRNLALQSAVSAPDPFNLIHTILAGIHPLDNPSRTVMPDFAGALTDTQIADLARYMRRTFSDQQPWDDLAAKVRAVRASIAMQSRQQTPIATSADLPGGE